MLNLELARKDARAIFELAVEDDKLLAYGRELKRVEGDLDGVAGIWGYFDNPGISRADKKILLKKCFEGELAGEVQNFLYLLVDKRRMAYFPEIVRVFEALSNEAQGIVIADVTTASSLDAGQESRLQEKLAGVTGKEVRLRLHEDPKVIGGVVVRIGDKRIDGSVTGRLARLTGDLMANM